jgi:hypothetical protein
MLGHALLLGRFIDWLLTSGRGAVLAATYPEFRAGAGSVGLTIFYVLAGMQVLAGLVFCAIAVVSRTTVLSGAIVALASVAWPVVHYGSGFGALEAQVLRQAVEAPPEVASAFVTLNVPVHVFHAAALVTALGALIAAPLTLPSTNRPGGSSHG